MNTETVTELTQVERIAAVILELGLTLESVFVPWSQSRNKAEKQPSLNWSVTLAIKGHDVLTTDYMAGSGHCPSAKIKVPPHWGRPKQDYHPAAARWECEQGYAAFYSHLSGFSRSGVPTKRKQLEPAIADVLYSLILDASVLDHSSFEDWASEFGYEPDSRKAESIYRACLEIALQLRNAIGEAGLQKLQEAFQDY